MASKPERNLWNTVRRWTAKDRHVFFQRHEDSAGQGIADTSFVIKPAPPLYSVRGWIELKAVREWPKRPTTPLRLKHFTPMQRNWLARQGKLGGNTWVLLQVDNEYLLIGWDSIAQLGFAPRDTLYKIADMHCTHRLDYDQFIHTLMMGN